MQKTLKTAIVVIGSFGFMGTSWALSAPEVSRLSAMDADSAASSQSVSVSEAERLGLPAEMIRQSNKGPRQEEIERNGPSAAAIAPAPKRFDVSVTLFPASAKSGAFSAPKKFHLTLAEGQPQRMDINPRRVSLQAVGVAGDIQDGDSLSFMGLARSNINAVAINVGAMRRTVSWSTFVVSRREDGNGDTDANDDANTNSGETAPADANGDTTPDGDANSDNAPGSTPERDGDHSSHRNQKAWAPEPIAANDDNDGAQNQEAMSTLALPNIAQQMDSQRSDFRVGDTKTFNTVAGRVVIKLDGIRMD